MRVRSSESMDKTKSIPAPFAPALRRRRVGDEGVKPQCQSVSRVLHADARLSMMLCWKCSVSEALTTEDSEYTDVFLPTPGPFNPSPAVHREASNTPAPFAPGSAGEKGWG